MNMPIVPTGLECLDKPQGVLVDSTYIGAVQGKGSGKADKQSRKE